MCIACAGIYRQVGHPARDCRAACCHPATRLWQVLQAPRCPARAVGLVGRACHATVRYPPGLHAPPAGAGGRHAGRCVARAAALSANRVHLPQVPAWPRHAHRRAMQRAAMPAGAAGRHAVTATPRAQCPHCKPTWPTRPAKALPASPQQAGRTAPTARHGQPGRPRTPIRQKAKGKRQKARGKGQDSLAHGGRPCPWLHCKGRTLRAARACANAPPLPPIRA